MVRNRKTIIQVIGLISLNLPENVFITTYAKSPNAMPFEMLYKNGIMQIVKNAGIEFPTEFQAIYNYIMGSFKEYKITKRTYAEKAVQNPQLLDYVASPVTINGIPTILTKTGRNMIKNKFLDKLSPQTQAEKQYSKILRAEHKKITYRQTLGLDKN